MAVAGPNWKPETTLAEAMHAHPCVKCGARFRCGGELYRDADGIGCRLFDDYDHDLCQDCEFRIYGDGE